VPSSDTRSSRDTHETYDPSDLPPSVVGRGADAYDPYAAPDFDAGDDADRYAADYRTRYARDYAGEARGQAGRQGRGGGRRPGTGLLVAAGAGALWFAARAFARRARHFDFAGRVALVTGGSRGLGLELARQLVDAGARVAVCARDEEALERARAELAERARARGGRAEDVFAAACDVSDEADVARFVGAVRGALGEVEVLVNNAGIIEVGPSEQMTRADFDEAMRTNFYGPLHLVLALAPGMRARKAGRVVNISSIGGKVSVPHLLPYSASKFALTGLSEGLRTTLAKDGVYVTSVYPGEMRTGSPQHATFKGDAAAEYTWFTTTDSAPVMSMPVPEAARRILSAARGGDAELIMPASAWVQALFHALFPAITQDLNALVERRMPGPVPGGERRHAGHEVDGDLPEWARPASRRRCASSTRARSSRRDPPARRLTRGPARGRERRGVAGAPRSV
jgi:NAD(P)-dependent dehydrogenase (short-subunit alcohol dehydrogenase family)